MAGKKRPRPMPAAESRSAAPAPSVLGRTASRLLRSTLYRRLSKISAIDAAFLTLDDGVIHVYTVVAEYNAQVYDALTRQERLIEKDWPGIQFDFHTRAHQGREPALAVPFGMQLVFTRR